MNLLVTGGAGFIGSNFARRVLQKTYSADDKIIVLDKLTYAGNTQNFSDLTHSSRFEFVCGDICDPSLVSSLVSKVDAVVNFAAESHVDRSIEDSSDFVKTNIEGVRVLLDAILKVNQNCRFLQISTDEVYGSISSGSWNENSPLLPNSPYSASKASGELLARSYFHTHGLDVVVTRCSNNYGPYHHPEKLIPLIITNLIQGKNIPIYGNGKNVRDWLHVDDHCNGIYLALSKGSSGETYNIGGGLELTNLEVARKILNLMGMDESKIEHVPDRKGHDLRYSINWEKIKNDLGYLPMVDFDLGIFETINWYKENSSWWS